MYIIFSISIRGGLFVENIVKALFIGGFRFNGKILKTDSFVKRFF